MHLRDYNYIIRWSNEDGEFVGLCEQFPSLSHLASSRQEAMSEISTYMSDIKNIIN